MSDMEKYSTSNNGVEHEHHDGDGSLPNLPPDPDAHLSAEERAARVRLLSYPLHGYCRLWIGAMQN
jgi:hypothetical protein